MTAMLADEWVEPFLGKKTHNWVYSTHDSSMPDDLLTLSPGISR